MDLVRFGRSIRALRSRRRWRQADLAAAAGISRAKVGRIELGNSATVPTGDLDRIAQALGALAVLRVDWNGEAIDRLLDAPHARLVERVGRLLLAAGWQVVTEATFAVWGERGSVDVLGWQPAARIVLVVEVKTVIPDQQAMLAAIDRKARLGLAIARDRGWQPAAVARILAVRDSRTSRRRIEEHPETYGSAFPDRSREIRRWLAAPTIPASASATGLALSGLLFLSDDHGASPRHRVAARRGRR